MPRSGIIGSFESSIPSLIRNVHIVFPKKLNQSTFCQQWIRVLFPQNLVVVCPSPGCQMNSDFYLCFGLGLGTKEDSSALTPHSTIHALSHSCFLSTSCLHSWGPLIPAPCSQLAEMAHIPTLELPRFLMPTENWHLSFSIFDWEAAHRNSKIINQWAKIKEPQNEEEIT